MLTDFQKREIALLVSNSLDLAESKWEQHSVSLEESSFKALALDHAEQHPSKIPGHPIVGESKVDTFIALVADIRDASKHLLCAVSHKNAKVSMLQRVFYETNALLPALEKTTNFFQGNVTEYLGDGILSLFKVEEDEDGINKEHIYAAHNAAKSCMHETKKIVNTELANRYSLPALDMGIGMALSKGLVTLVGIPENMHPKVFGECVYRATKLSYGRNEIIVDQKLRSAWPKTKGGTIKFVDKGSKYSNVQGFSIEKNQ